MMQEMADYYSKGDTTALIETFMQGLYVDFGKAKNSSKNYKFCKSLSEARAYLEENGGTLFINTKGSLTKNAYLYHATIVNFTQVNKFPYLVIISC
jgi:hypothetical protein